MLALKDLTILFIILLFHNAVFEPSKTVPTKTLPEFLHRNDQSTILKEKLVASMCCKGPYLGPKIRPIS